MACGLYLSVFRLGLADRIEIGSFLLLSISSPSKVRGLYSILREHWHKISRPLGMVVLKQHSRLLMTVQLDGLKSNLRMTGPGRNSRFAGLSILNGHWTSNR